MRFRLALIGLCILLAFVLVACEEQPNNLPDEKPH